MITPHHAETRLSTLEPTSEELWAFLLRLEPVATDNATRMSGWGNIDWWLLGNSVATGIFLIATALYLVGWCVRRA